MYKYEREINMNSPLASQPDKITVPLKSHQLACLYKSIEMEKTGTINYNFDNMKIEVKTNVGIIGDIVGYGKTLTALSIVASSKLKDIHINNQRIVSYCSSTNYSYLSYSTNNTKILHNDNIINSTLIIVPRGPVYVQWEKTLKEKTTLSYIAIDNVYSIKKFLPEYKNGNRDEIIEFFNKFDVVLIKNTTLELLLNYYRIPVNDTSNDPCRLTFIKRWKRIMIDEAHDICYKIPLMHYDFLWMITGTYQYLLDGCRNCSSIMYSIKDSINFDTIDLILVKCTKETVKNSFKIPTPREKYYECKMPAQISIIRNFINSNILEKINANDIYGAIRDLGGKSETEDNIIELVSREIKRELINKEREKEYISSLDIPSDVKANKIKNIDNDIAIIQNKIQNLTERVTELNTKTCSICMCVMEYPIVTECTHSFCFGCIMQWIVKKKNCPECRKEISIDNLISVTDKPNVVAKREETYTKEDTLLKIIEKNPNGKYLVFSKHDHYNLHDKLKLHNISFAELKGNTSHMMNILDKFKNGELQVILLNTYHAGSGIDISFATDVVIFHNIGIAKHQAIGRAQRVGRTEELNIHYLYYKHEMDK